MELPQIQDLQKAIDIVGKTVTLQFKEAKTQYSQSELTEIQNKNARIQERMNEAFQKLQNGSVSFRESQLQYSDVSKDAQSFFASENPSAADALASIKEGEYTNVIEFPNKLAVYKLVEKTQKERQNLSDESKAAQGSQTVNESYYTVKPLVLNLIPETPQGGFARTDLNGKHFERADVKINQFGKPEVQIRFNDEGGKLFEEITRRNVGKPVAIFLDGEMISSPRVQTAISDGVAMITGNFTLAEAKELAMQLNTGAIPAPIKLVAQQKIGAALGQESLDMGINAGLIGIVLVMLYMITYYRGAGLIASFALLLYTGLVLAVFQLFGLTLNLAGIAGFILSVGMAVDANILIFERMKEELDKGKSVNEAINIGFDRAWSSIRDSNVTSLITAAILFLFASGMVRGFAIALGVGILISMFTAIMITRNVLLMTTKNKDSVSKLYI